MNVQALMGLFPQKTRVTLIHATSGKLIGIHKIKPEQLPTTFNKPINIKLQGETWRVMQAEPVNAKDFTLGNKLTLHVQEPLTLDPNILGYNFATICEDIPPMDTGPLFNDFVLDISKDGWLQLQFLAASLLPAVQEELLQIEKILFPGQGINTLSGYKNMHIRKKISSYPLNISNAEFCELSGIKQKGGVRYNSADFVQNGFVYRSDNYTYYGIIEGDRIAELCLLSFESADEELLQTMSFFNLILADWCNARVIMT